MSNKFNPKNVIRLIILILVAITPVFNIGEVMAFVSGTLKSQSVIETTIYIKFIKDIGFFSIIFFSSLAIFKKKKINRLFLIYIPLIILTTLLFVISYLNHPILALAGIRWILPVFLSFFLINHVNDKLMEEVGKVLFILILISLAAQVYQLFYASKWFGVNAFGLAGRVPGIFLIPNTSGFFVCLGLFFNYFFSKNYYKKILILVLGSFSIFLTQSGTAIATLLLAAFTVVAYKIIKRRNFIIFLFLFPPILVILLLATLSLLPTLTARGENILSISGASRWNFFIETLNNSQLIETEFGKGTNTSVVLQADSIITDSMYIAIIYNTGIIGSVIFLAMILIWLFYTVRSKRLDVICFTLIYSLFSATTNITEAFPMNLLLALGLAYYAPLIPIGKIRKNNYEYR